MSASSQSNCESLLRFSHSFFASLCFVLCMLVFDNNTCHNMCLFLHQIHIPSLQTSRFSPLPDISNPYSLLRLFWHSIELIVVGVFFAKDSPTSLFWKYFFRFGGRKKNFVSQFHHNGSFGSTLTLRNIPRSETGNKSLKLFKIFFPFKNKSLS